MPHRAHMMKSSCLRCDNRHQSEWCALEGDDLLFLDHAKLCNLYPAGTTIFYQGNPCVGLFCVESGSVAIRKNDPLGNSVIVRLAYPGQILGYRAFFSGKPYAASAETLSETKLCFFEREKITQLMERRPELAMQFLHRMATEFEAAETAKLQSVTLSVRTQLVHLLLGLRNRYGVVDAEGRIVIELPISRQDIASMIGTRPETVARTIRALHDSGAAQFHGRQVVVDDLDVLLDEVEGNDV